MIYLTILILLFLLSFHYDVCGKKANKELWYLITLCMFILFAGLRWRTGTDTIHYLHSFYHEYPSLADFSFKEYYVGRDPFYVFLNSFVKSVGGRFYIVQIIHAAFVNILIFNYFKKHSKYIFTCITFYFLISYVSFSMEIMRASFSIVISLYAFDFFIERKWVKGYFLLFIAVMFHAQTLAVFFFPAFLFLRLNKNGLLILIGAYILGIFLQNLLADYVMLFEGTEKLEQKFSDYTSEDSPLGKNSRNINYFILYTIPKLIYPLFALWYTKKMFKKNRNSNLERLEPLAMLGIIFIFIENSFLIAYRYVEYFTIYFALLYAETCINMVTNAKKMKKSIAYTKTLCFFFPIMISLVYSVALREPIWTYSSVLDRTINKEAEAELEDIWIITYVPPNYNEY